MKIIDSPVLGIGVLLCVGLAVLGLTFMATADGQNSTATSVSTTDEVATVTFLRTLPQRHASPMHTDDDDSPFLDAGVSEPVNARQVVRAQTAVQPQEPQQNVARLTARAIIDLPSLSVTTQSDDDPFTSTPAQPTRQRVEVRQNGVAPPSTFRDERPSEPQPQRPRAEDRPNDLQQQISTRTVEVREVRNAAAPNRSEKRDELLFRIVQLRLLRGEYEKITPAVLQMQNPEKAIEAMLDHAEESEDEDIEQLLDVATALTMQIGQPRPAVPVGMRMPGTSPFGPSIGVPPGAQDKATQTYFSSEP